MENYNNFGNCILFCIDMFNNCHGRICDYSFLLKDPEYVWQMF